MINPYSEDERLQVMLTCCFSAVKSGFQHLAMRDIIEPPHEWFDAMLARQIVIHLFHSQFDVPKRRIHEMMNRRRGSIAAAIYTVDNRLECAVFAKAYNRMAGRANDLFMREIKKAAA